MSEKRVQRRIEQSAGTGKMMRAGEALGSVSYLLEIWQTFHIITGLGSGPAEEVAGIKEIKIRLVRHQLDTFKLWHDSATLTLHLEDGRHLDGFLNGAEFVAGGQLMGA